MTSVLDDCSLQIDYRHFDAVSSVIDFSFLTTVTHTTQPLEQHRTPIRVWIWSELYGLGVR